MLDSGVRRIGHRTNIRRALALLVLGMWVWALAGTVVEGGRGHRHDVGGSPGPACGVCTLSLGLLEGPIESPKPVEPVPTFPAARPPILTAPPTSMPDDHPGRGPPPAIPSP